MIFSSFRLVVKCFFASDILLMGMASRTTVAGPADFIGSRVV